jgi:hypothetical protein
MKYVWAMVSFGGVPSVDGFIKRHELHNQLKKMNVDGADMEKQYGCIKFHAKHYGGHGAKLTLAVRNKWFAGWTRSWLYCKVPLVWSPIPVRGKSVYALWSSMAPLDFSMEPSFKCADDDSRDTALVSAMASFGFIEIADGETPISKVVLPLLEFPLAKLQGESNDHFLVRVELGVENVMDSYGRVEHDACIKALPNEGRLSRCWTQQELIASPNHSILSHGCKEEDEQGFGGDECRGADSSYILAYLFTSMGTNYRGALGLK